MKTTIIATAILLTSVVMTSAFHNWLALGMFFIGMVCAAFFSYKHD